MKLLDYHQLQRQEQEGCASPALKRAVGSRFVERVTWMLAAVDGRFETPWPGIDRGRLFEAGEAISRLYLESSPDQRQYIRSRTWDRDLKGPTLHMFALRAAVVAMRERSRDRLMVAMAAMAIADIGPDVRDTLMSMPVLFCAAKEVTGDAAQVFHEAAAISGPAMAAVLTDFAARPPELQTLKVMGWRQVETDEGVSFQWQWP